MCRFPPHSRVTTKTIFITWVPSTCFCRRRYHSRLDISYLLALHLLPLITICMAHTLAGWLFSRLVNFSYSIIKWWACEQRELERWRNKEFSFTAPPFRFYVCCFFFHLFTFSVCVIKDMRNLFSISLMGFANKPILNFLLLPVFIIWILVYCVVALRRQPKQSSIMCEMQKYHHMGEWFPFD